MPYKVLLIVEDKWWSDGETFASFGAARTHQGIVARKWSTSETAIEAPDGRVLNYRESEDFLAGIQTDEGRGGSMTLPTVEKNTILVIRTDGTEEIVKGKPRVQTMHTLIGAETLDFVRIGKLEPNDLTMAVDDMGWETVTVDHGDGRIELKPVRARKPINAKATALYFAICRPGTTHQIAGDVAVFHDEDIP